MASQTSKVKRRGRNRRDEYCLANTSKSPDEIKEKKKAKGKRGLNGIFNEIEYEDALGALKNYYSSRCDSKLLSWQTDCDGLYLHYRRELIWYHIRCGYSRKVIQQQLMQTFGISQSTSKTWYLDALQSAITDPENGKRETKEIIMEQNNMILQQCLSKGDYKNALTALNQMAKLTGIYEPEEVKVAETIKFKFGE